MSPSGAMAEGDNTKKILLGVGCGCLSLVTLCCASSAGGALFMKSGHDSAAQAHAERFLGAAQASDWPGAYAATLSLYDSGLSSQYVHQRCLGATPLADVSSFECSGVESSWPDGDGADVLCIVQSRSQGAQEVTVHVNSPESGPYLGFVWFAPTAVLGPDWRGDQCTLWSGREYYRDPPAGRVRP